MFVLDTNVVSELRKARSGKADQRVAAWSESVDATTLYLAAISVHELEYGALVLARRDPPQGERILRWLDDLLATTFRNRILPLDEAVARRSAALHVSDPCPFRDGLIAATALVHNMTVVTRNVRDFERTGVMLLNPWEFDRG